MKQIILKFTLCLLSILLLLCSGCKKKPTSMADTSSTANATERPLKEVEPISTLPPSDGTGLQLTEFTYKEVDPTDNPSICTSLYSYAENLDDLFAVTAEVVLGEVKKVTEYEYTSKYNNNPDTKNYFNGVEFKVQKSYGGKKDLSGKTIKIMHGISQHKDYGPCYPTLEIGKKYFLFLLNSDHCYKGKPAMSKFIKDFPYVLPTTMEGVAEKIGDGYNIAYIEAISKGEFDPLKLEDRLQKKASRKSIEKIINANIDKMRGITPVELEVEKINNN